MQTEPQYFYLSKVQPRTTITYFHRLSFTQTKEIFKQPLEILGISITSRHKHFSYFFLILYVQVSYTLKAMVHMGRTMGAVAVQCMAAEIQCCQARPRSSACVKRFATDARRKKRCKFEISVSSLPLKNYLDFCLLESIGY